MQIKSTLIPKHKVFIELENNCNRICSLFYCHKFHKEASTVVDHIPSYFYKLHGVEVLKIFDPCYQDITKEAKWINSQPYHADNLELNEVINNQVDL